MIKDSSWVRQSNLLPKNAINAEDTYYRNYTSAYYKYTGTGLGENFAMNPPPQPSDNADPVAPRYLDILQREKDMPYSPGMGRWYSETIDDNANLVHIRYGIPVYNSLTSFFGNFYNADDSRLVRTGRANTIGSFIGKAIGWAFSLRLLPLIMIGTAWKFFTEVTSTRFAYLKPMMGTYWKYVNDMANTIAANMELTSKSTGSWMRFAEQTGLTPGGSMKLSQEQVSAIAKKEFQPSDAEANMYAKMAPDIYKSRDDDGKVLTGIDVYAVATRAQRLANAFNEGVNRIAAAQQGNPNGVMQAVRQWVEGGAASRVMSAAMTPEYASTEDFLNAYYGQTDGRLLSGTTTSPDGEEATNSSVAVKNTAPEANPDNKTAEENTAPAADAATQAQGGGSESLLVSTYETVKDFFSTENYEGAWATFRGAQKDGSAWVTFRIDGRDSVSESFSNSSRESTVGQAFNSTSANNRNMRISLADGNLSNIPGIGAIANFVKDIATGVADSLHIAGVGALAGNAFVDIPKHYDESSAQFNQLSFTMQLRAPYGNDLCRYQTEILPMIMMLAGILPRSEGTGAYGSPFLCEWYCRGRGQSRLALFKSLEIERGVSNAPWSQSGKYRGINLRCTFEDLSSVVHMPMNEISGWRVIDPTQWNKLLFPQDSSMGDYMSVLASCGLSEQVYKMDKLKRNWYTNMSSFNKWFSVSSRVNALFDGNRGMLLSALSKGDRG